MSSSFHHGHDTQSHTARVIDEMRLYGRAPEDGEIDARPLPELAELEGAVADIVDAIVAPLTGTCLEADIEDLLFAAADLFHRKLTRIGRELDDNEMRQKREQAEQDGSDIRSTELERTIDKGRLILERQSAFEHLRDTAILAYEAQTGSAWRPRSGSLVSHKTLTAAVIDSRDFIAAKRRAEIEPLMPAGTRIAFSGGSDCNDHASIWAVLDKARAAHPDMVLLHGASPKGAEAIASAWASNRKVSQIAYKPDWDRDQKAAPFRRNDRMLDAMPKAVIVFPGSGITDNLADKAKKLGIRVSDHRKRGA